MSGGSSRGRYGDRMGVWNGPVNEHVTADLFVRAPFLAKRMPFIISSPQCFSRLKSRSRAACWRGVVVGSQSAYRLPLYSGVADLDLTGLLPEQTSPDSSCGYLSALCACLCRRGHPQDCLSDHRRPDRRGHKPDLDSCIRRASPHDLVRLRYGVTVSVGPWH